MIPQVACDDGGNLVLAQGAPEWQLVSAGLTTTIYKGDLTLSFTICTYDPTAMAVMAFGCCGPHVNAEAYTFIVGPDPAASVNAMLTTRLS